MPGLNEIGIMQGRLSPATAGRLQSFPWTTWRDEFAQAHELGFDVIEWLVTDERIEENPIWTDAGLREIQARVIDSGVGLRSVCADYFISRPFIRASKERRSKSVETLEHLIVQCASLGVAVLLVPVLEGGELQTVGDEEILLECLREPLSFAEKHGVCIGLEMELPAEKCLHLIERGRSRFLGTYYDTGNAAAAGFDVAADIRAHGSQLRGIHIKDRKRGGSSVTLGCGDANFASVFEAIDSVGYEGPLILETPVGKDPRVTAAAHLAFVRRHLHSMTRS